MLKETVIQTIKRYNLIESGDTIVIGVSGGPDSICMLHVLNEIKKEMNFSIYVAHVNHMIRDVAESETKYVEDFCKKLDVECFTKRIDVLKLAKEEKKGTEETGRDIRYEFFGEVAEKVKANKIATAHNNNDSIETVIMNILRGSAISGLKGIEPIREKFIRPLIEIEREDIEAYCKEYNLEPKYDETNNENDYTRNKIRNIAIPYIKKEFNPNIVKTLTRLTLVAREEDNYLNEVAKKEYDSMVLDKTETGIILDLKLFNSLELVIKRRVILYTINELAKTVAGIEKINIDDCIKLCKNNIGNKYLTPVKNIKILVKKGRIFFTKERDLP